MLKYMKFALNWGHPDFPTSKICVVTTFQIWDIEKLLFKKNDFDKFSKPIKNSMGNWV